MTLLHVTGPKLDCGILQVLRAAFPDHALMGEEGGVSGNPSSDYLWCIDPLDGTTNYTHKYPSFACSVAVLEKAEAVAGVVVEFAGGPGTWIQRTYTSILHIFSNPSIMLRHCPRSPIGLHRLRPRIRDHSMVLRAGRHEAYISVETFAVKIQGLSLDLPLQACRV